MSRGDSETSTQGEEGQEAVTVDVVTISKADRKSFEQLTPKSLRRVRFKDECQDPIEVLNSEICNPRRVEWPPRESMEKEAPSPSPTCERVIKLATVPPMHIGMVAISKARRKRIDEDFLNFQGAAPVFSSGPFSNAAFEPKKLSSEKRWKPSTFESAPSKQMLHERPQKVLRSSSSVLTQGKSDKQAKYKMPPGTAKGHKHSKQGI